VNEQLGKPRDPLAKWDTVAKFATPLAVAFVGALFAWLQEVDSRRSTESRYFTDLMAQREKADSDLRQRMFEVLINNYFGAPASGGAGHLAGTGVDDTAPDPEAGRVEQDLHRIHRQIIFASLLSRNFDNIDIRPLFEELDKELTAYIWPAGGAPGEPGPLRERAFALREDLRRLAIGVSTRQATALASLKREGEAAQGRTQVFSQLLCAGDRNVLLSARFLLSGWKDGEVTLKVLPTLTAASVYLPTGRRERRLGAPDGRVKTDDTQLNVTFYDTPLLENVRFSDGTRGAFTLRNYTAFDACQTFAGQMDQGQQTDCASLRNIQAATQKACDAAIIVLTEIPDWYIAPRDRPYVTDLLAGRFSGSEAR
jgi:hypothetical protein